MILLWFALLIWDICLNSSAVGIKSRRICISDFSLLYGTNTLDATGGTWGPLAGPLTLEALRFSLEVASFNWEYALDIASWRFCKLFLAWLISSKEVYKAFHGDEKKTRKFLNQHYNSWIFLG